MPKIPWLYQRKPTIVVSATAATDINRRVRSSLTCSTRDMVPSGLVRARRCRGSNRDRNEGVRTAFT